MPEVFVACDREQSFLLPPSLLEWVPEDQLVWTILGAVDELDLTGIYRAYGSDGHGPPAYEPRTVVAWLLYSYSKGIQSSREIERRCREDVAFMVITARDNNVENGVQTNSMKAGPAQSTSGGVDPPRLEISL